MYVDHRYKSPQEVRTTTLTHTIEDYFKMNSSRLLTLSRERVEFSPFFGMYHKGWRMELCVALAGAAFLLQTQRWEGG